MSSEAVSHTFTPSSIVTPPPQVSDSAHTKLLSGQLHFPEEGEEGAGRPKRKSGSLTELAHPR